MGCSRFEKDALPTSVTPGVSMNRLALRISVVCLPKRGVQLGILLLVTWLGACNTLLGIHDASKVPTTRDANADFSSTEAGLRDTQTEDTGGDSIRTVDSSVLGDSLDSRDVFGASDTLAASSDLAGDGTLDPLVDARPDPDRRPDMADAVPSSDSIVVAGFDAHQPSDTQVTGASDSLESDGGQDLADTGSTCTEGSTCVLGDGMVGIRVALTDPCPSNYGGGEVRLKAGPDPGLLCSGCTCTTSFSCEAAIYEYQDTTYCLSDTTNRGTIPVGKLRAGAPCGVERHPFSLDPFLPVASCSPVGTPQLPAVGWSGQLKICLDTNLPRSCPGGLCLSGTQTGRCILLDGDGACPTGFGKYLGAQLWYQDFEDGRSCSSCGCVLSDQGTCTDVVPYKSSGMCNGGNPTEPKTCGFPADIGFAYVHAVGTGTAPTCSATSPILGAVKLKGPTTICCQ